MGKMDGTLALGRYRTTMTETQYYKNITDKNIAIFGITPPPFGGVSIHIQRVAQKFKENKNQVYHFKTEFRGRRYVLPFYLLYAAFFLIKNKIDIVSRSWA